jgi:hypothetical protein
MLRNFAYGGLALVGGAITGIAISSWATPLSPPQISSEVARVAQPAMTMAATSSRVASDASDCSPWDVSDIAMEVTLKEMIRRGWRPPTQGEVIETAYGNPGVMAIEPDASVPVRGYAPAPGSSEEGGATEATEPFPVDQMLSTSEGASPVAPVASPPPPAAPPIVIEPAQAPTSQASPDQGAAG